jgi:N6-adenosine-specific RNA methylase IME4
MTDRYGVIAVDPPWTFSTYSRKGKGRSAEAHYDCMTADEIKAMPIDQWAADDCVLFLWVTDPLLEVGLEVMRAWRFRYKTVGFYWAKTAKLDNNLWTTGLGFWTRANPEQCLLGTRGRPRRAAGATNVKKLIVSPRRAHSQKPDEAYERMQTLCTGPYLALFERGSRPGWTVLGNEAETGIGARRWHSDARELRDEFETPP